MRIGPFALSTGFKIPLNNEQFRLGADVLVYWLNRAGEMAERLKAAVC
jgi:hypothetical protein